MSIIAKNWYIIKIKTGNLIKYIREILMVIIVIVIESAINQETPNDCPRKIIRRSLRNFRTLLYMMIRFKCNE